LTRHLVILTGPSHAGKTSAISLARRSLNCRSAVIAVDDIIAGLNLGEEDLWEAGLPAAYDVAVASSEALLRRDFTVFVESTFTFVPSDGRPPTVHPEQLLRLIDMAEQTGAPWLVVRLTTTAEELARRQEATGRLDQTVVSGTWGLHRDWTLGVDAHELDTGATATDQIAAALIAALCDPPSERR